jgi:flagellar hook assembly protein FlgD
LPQDGYVVILRGDTTLVTSVPTPNKLVPTSDELKQNYPNPFNPSTTIEYTLQKQEYVSIKIYDITGKEITSLVNSEQNAGNYRVIWNGKTDRGTTVASGVYFYQLRTPTMKATKKIIHLQ